MPCDNWRAQVQAHDDLQKLIHRVEPVEWCYDGLGGSIIKWTMEEGGSPADHPSILAFLVGIDGTVESMLDGGGQYNSSSFTKWLEAGVKAYEQDHPRTRLPFVLTDVVEKKSGTDTEYKVKALEAAHASGSHVLLFFGRDRFGERDKAAKKQARATKSFCKSVLNSKQAEKYAAGWTFLRFDLADEAHAGYATSLGVEDVPAILMWLPGAEAPTDLGPRLTAAALANVLKKNPVESASEDD